MAGGFAPAQYTASCCSADHGASAACRIQTGVNAEPVSPAPWGARRPAAAPRGLPGAALPLGPGTAQAPRALDPGGAGRGFGAGEKIPEPLELHRLDRIVRHRRRLKLAIAQNLE